MYSHHYTPFKCRKLMAFYTNHFYLITMYTSNIIHIMLHDHLVVSTKEPKQKISWREH